MTATTTSAPNAAYEATNAQDHSASRPARRVGDSPDSSSELELAPSRPRKSSVVSPETSAGLLEPRARPPIADDARGDHHARLRADQCAPRDRRISASEAFRVLCMTFSALGIFARRKQFRQKFFAGFGWVRFGWFFNPSIDPQYSRLPQNRFPPIRADDARTRARWHIRAPCVCAHPDFIGVAWPGFGAILAHSTSVRHPTPPKRQLRWLASAPPSCPCAPSRPSAGANASPA